MRYLSIDALPLLFEGGISNYTRPLVENILICADPTWQVELLFRLSTSRSRRKLYRKYEQCCSSRPSGHRLTFVPDRLLAELWKRGISLPSLRASKSDDVFVATTELVPRKNKTKVGWIIYDLMQLRIPQYFPIDKEAFHASALERAQRTDFIVAISENTKKDVIELLNYPEERVCVVYPGRSLVKNPPEDKASCAQRRPYIYYLGSMALNKNVDGMLRVFARCIHEHGLDLDLILTGKNFCGRHFWERLVGELGIEKRVQFTGWIVDEERMKLLDNATMLWQFSWYEGFGLPVLEAASRGIPVLYTNRGAVPEILRNPEQEIDPANEEEAAAQAATALNSPEILASWKAAGLKRATEFSWDKSSSKLLKWLEAEL